MIIAKRIYLLATAELTEDAMNCVVLLSQNMSEHMESWIITHQHFCRLPKFTDAGHHVVDTAFFQSSIPNKQRNCLSTCAIKY